MRDIAIHIARAAAGGALALLAAAPAIAQAPAAGGYPNKPLKVIVPQPPGGGFDFVGRVLAEKMAVRLGQPVVVENRTGSGTVVGTDAAAKAPADGYTLLTGSVSNIALNPGLYANLPYDPLRDFTPVGLAVAYSYTLIGRKDLPFNTLPELIAHAKANPGKLNYASGGTGSGQHVLAAALWRLAGVELTHVPYRGAQPAYTDLLGGRVDVFFDLSPTARPHVDNGSLKALAVSGAQRNPMHPGVPTIRETGVAPLELESWFGYFAPARTPPADLARLRAEFQAVAAAPDVRERFEKAGGTPMALVGAEADALVRRDVERWTRIVRDIGIKAE
ncbi:MAG: tripartite tricarboxylate transporter substrate binding protein [Burkholderiaceae bacterium]|nr:tripartite tricarboxylate transporter substrate binding protein [Burkholderiaceae bacterium]